MRRLVERASFVVIAACVAVGLYSFVQLAISFWSAQN